MIAAMEPVLFRSFKMGFMDCTRATIDFINETASHADKKEQIIEHITESCMKTFQSQTPPHSFTHHHEIAFSNVNPSDQFTPFPLLSSSFGEMEWPSLEERLGFSPIEKSSFLLPEIKPLPDLLSTSLLKVAEPRTSAFNLVGRVCSMSDSSFESPSTSKTSQGGAIVGSDSMHGDSSDDEDAKLIIDDPNNNQAAWRPWLWLIIGVAIQFKLYTALSLWRKINTLSKFDSLVIDRPKRKQQLSSWENQKFANNNFCWGFPPPTHW